MHIARTHICALHFPRSITIKHKTREKKLETFATVICNRLMKCILFILIWCGLGWAWYWRFESHACYRIEYYNYTFWYSCFFTTTFRFLQLLSGKKQPTWCWPFAKWLSYGIFSLKSKRNTLKFEQQNRFLRSYHTGWSVVNGQ